MKCRDLLVALPLVSGSPAFADDDPPTVLPCRPTVACTAEIAPEGTLQVETGYAQRRASSSAVSTVPTLVMYSVTDRVQLQLGTNNAVVSEGGATRVFDGALVGPKVVLLEQTDTTPAISMSALFAIPTRTGTDAVTKTTDAYLWAYASKDILGFHADLDVGANVLSVDDHPAVQGVAALSVSHDLIGGVGVMAEAYAFEGGGSYASHDGGILSAISIAATKRVMFDVGTDVGLYRDTRRMTLFAGITFAPIAPSHAHVSPAAIAKAATVPTELLAASDDAASTAPEPTAPAEPAAESDEVDYKATLTGDWNGTRAFLAKNGIGTELTYIVDVMANPVGGKKHGVRGLDNLNAIVTLDGEKLVGATGTSAKIYFHHNNRGAPDADLIGSAQGVDNIEVGDANSPLYEAWLQQNFAGDVVSVRAGLYDLNSEFYVTDTSGLFIHPTYGIGTDMSQTGQAGPSIFPLCALAARVKVQPDDAFYVQAAALDAIPNDVSFSGGELLVGEAGFTPKGSKIAVGGYLYTKPFADVMDETVLGRSEGGYVVAEHQVYSEPGSDDQGARVFARAGVANADVNQFDLSWSAGAVYTGLFPTRDKGSLGLAMAGARNGDPYKMMMASSSATMASSEMQVELTYKDAVTPWLSVQLDSQYIIHPGADAAADNAFLVGSRITGSF